MSSIDQPAADLPLTVNVNQPPSSAFATSKDISTATTSYKTPNVDTISLNEDLDCPTENRHMFGFFCPTCRSIPMEWGPKLPRVYTPGNKLIKVGPRRGAVDGVDLQDEEAIAALSTIVYCDCRGLHYKDIPGLLALMEKHTKSVEAGQRIAEMYQTINRAARQEEEDLVPEFYQLVESCLRNPCQDAKTFVIKALAKLSNFQGLPDGHEPEIPPHPFDTGSQPSFTHASSPGEDEDGLDWIKRPVITASQAHTPAPRGNWKFVDGTDLSEAVVGKPEPWKWFLIRQDKNDPSKIDIREYPRIRTFDFNDHNDVRALNKNRKQIIDRTDAPEKDSRPPWTLLEKQTLEELIREDFKTGKTGKTLDWKSIAERLEKKFENVLQKEGVALAQTSRKIKGEWVFPLRKDPKLPKERLGPAKRNASAVSIQAKKYHDILALINGTEAEDESIKSSGMMGGGGDGNGNKEDKYALGDGSPKPKKRKRVDGEENQIVRIHGGENGGENGNDQGYMTISSSSKTNPKTPTPKEPKKGLKGKTTQTSAKRQGSSKPPSPPSFPNLVN
ncbi:hypothetical protein BDZ45DRAFT_683700 [Acephala macrosclerotiorum]|nr:hypothetical protein BDZ45DRAFT_683700 [Acephala macrosclerotiorum]